MNKMRKKRKRLPRIFIWVNSSGLNLVKSKFSEAGIYQKNIEENSKLFRLKNVFFFFFAISLTCSLKRVDRTLSRIPHMFDKASRRNAYSPHIKFFTTTRRQNTYL